MAFFTAVGIIVSVLFALFALAILLAGWRLKRSLKQLTALSETSIGAATPARVHLQRREKIVWNDEASANGYLQSLWRLGFQDAGSYEIAEMHGLKVRALARPEEHLWSVIYEHPVAGVWMDFVTRYAEGGSLTTTNARHGDELEQRPGYDKIYEPAMNADGLYEKHRTARRGVSFKEVMPANFAREFEKAYADEMDWRLSRGGATESEIRAVAAKSGRKLTDEELALLRQAQQSQASVALTEAIRDRFLEQTTLSAAEWEKIRDQLVIIHERMTPDEVLANFENWSFLHENEFKDESETDDAGNAPAYPAQLRPRQGFEHLNSTLSAARRFQKIAELLEPVPADIYRASDTAFGA